MGEYGMVILEDLLWRIPSPGYFGGLGRTLMPDGIFWTGDGEEADATINR